MAGLSGSSDWGGCGDEHPLFIDAGGGAERVGEVLQGTRVEVVGAAGPYSRVHVIGPAVREVPAPITFAPGVEALMLRQDAVSCN